jgi:hypothetical protein
MSRDITRRYAFAAILFNVSGLAPPETVETEGPGVPSTRCLPAPARTERVHDEGAGRDAGGCPARPSHFSRVAERSGSEVAPRAVRCNRSLAGCLLESQRLAINEEANRLLQTSGLRLLVLGRLYPADVPSTM